MQQAPSNTKERETAQAWARKALSSKALIIDTETTGIGLFDEIVQIAAINMQGETLLDMFLKPSKAIPVDAARVHGISDAMVKDAPGFQDVYEQLKTLLHGQDWVIYNLDYDVRMIKQDCLRCGLELIKPASGACAMLHYAGYHGAWNDYRESWAWQKLGIAAQRHKINVTAPEHSALGDVLRTLELMKVMAQ